MYPLTLHVRFGEHHSAWLLNRDKVLAARLKRLQERTPGAAVDRAAVEQSTPAVIQIPLDTLAMTVKFGRSIRHIPGVLEAVQPVTPEFTEDEIDVIVEQ
jgi:hypothetical protein